MSDINVLKEFLVRIRYAEEQASRIKAINGVNSFGSAIFKLGAAAAAGVTAVIYATTKYADAMNSTYLMTQRLGMGIKSFKSMSSAAAELGDSVEGMQGSMKGFASFIRGNPFGSISFMQGINKNIRATDTNDVKLQKLAKTFQEEANDPMRQAINIRKAAMMGISEDTYLSMANPKFNTLQKQHEEALKTSEFEKSGEVANQFKISKDLMMDNLESGMSKFMIEPMENGKEGMDELTEYANDAGDSLSRLSKITDKLVDGLTGVVQSTAQFVGSIAGFVGDLDSGKSFAAATTNLSKNLFKADKFDTPSKEYLERKKHRHVENEGLGSDAVKVLNFLIPNSIRKRTDEGMKQLIEAGLTPEQSAAIMANFTHESNLDPGAIGDSGKAFGIGQWNPDRQARYKKLFGATMKADVFSDKKLAFKRQIDFAKYELDNYELTSMNKLRNSDKTAYTQGIIVADSYERHGMGMGESIRRGKDAQKLIDRYNYAQRIRTDRVDIDHKTGPWKDRSEQSSNQYIQNITINGITEPEKVKRKVAELASRNTAAVHL